MNIIDRYTVKVFGAGDRPTYICRTCRQQVKAENLRVHHEEHRSNE